MARIAFILLCHKDPAAVIRQVEGLIAAGDSVAIHYDANAPQAEYQRLRDTFDRVPNVTFPRRRLRCGWGTWSLVQATLNTARAAAEAFPRATHFYLISGDCMAIKSAEFARQKLDARACDYIESVDFMSSGWIKTGWKKERLIYRHWFNERRQPGLFYACFEVQKRLGLTRETPKGMDIRIGSQWWCLRRRTLEAIFEFIDRRRDVVRFFRTTWIPDEIFFQTIVRQVVPEHEIDSRTLTFLMFTDYGLPVTFYNDHYDLLLAQDALFARKISPEAQELRRRLGVLWSARGLQFRESSEGRALFAFLTERGREGRRFARRFWEADLDPVHARVLSMVLCKKWEVAQRLLAPIEKATGKPTLGYLFTQDDCALPDLGGLESSMIKRQRHRRALVQMLYDYYDSDQLLICLDPSNLDFVQDFARGQLRTRVLEIDCTYPRAFLEAHARRGGLAGDSTPPDQVDRLLPAIKADFQHESDKLRGADLPALWHLRETDPPARQAEALAGFLDIAPQEARALLATPDLFKD